MRWLYRNTAVGNEAFIEYCYGRGCCIVGVSEIAVVGSLAVGSLAVGSHTVGSHTVGVLWWYLYYWFEYLLGFLLKGVVSQH